MAVIALLFPASFSPITVLAPGENSNFDEKRLRKFFIWIYFKNIKASPIFHNKFMSCMI